ncbi:LysR family transcriptional regulator [Salinicoccus halitifaciens]|uniref:DNA-binding transcriptional LysR family regulator n=1 Tax=Salinicoccus halitifaciens TaxID=1073415 RepID=A0ABV2EC46_9STAP|nr:LysR family transcriptional regulator [Salinicoccus halitifaciens]MCD2137338.1 LysR family transcriptional regulator [Salinicoccus halitifaciens]
MNEIQLQTFLTIVEHKSYSKAAAVLNVTQPTITSRIKALEDIMQCELFKRVGHEIFLTNEGNMLTEYANKILIYIKHSKEIPNILKSPVIKVGFSPGYDYSFIIELLKTVKSIGGMDIRVTEGHDSVSLNESILSGEMDIVFTREVLADSREVVSEYLFENNLILVLPANHHLCSRQSISVEDLNNETIISFRRNSVLWQLIDKELIGANNLTRIDVENNEMLLKAVANDIGIGIIPELGIDKRHEPGIEVREISNLYNLQNSVYVQYRKNPQMEKVAKKIIYSIIQHKYSVAHAE